MREIVVPETKPATEWVNGRALRKVSPQRKHALAQAAFAGALLAWARQSGCGRVGTEWDFRIAPPGEIRRPVVPDVAFLSYARVPYESATDADIPRAAPDVVVEVLSPGDRTADVHEKIRVYLTAGTSVVFLVNTKRQTVTAHRVSGTRVFSKEEDLRDEALPGFSIPVRTLFEEPRPPNRRDVVTDL